jgi:hypothetical protein
MPSLSLDPGDAAELAEMLQFPSDWLASDHAALDASLTRYTGTSAYNASTLRNDLDRFTFLLGGSDGETLFHPGQK